MIDAARSWLDPHRAEPDVAAADAAAACLGAAVHRQLLAAGDRLARRSDGVALAFYRHAAEAYATYGSAGFARWLELGAALLEETPSSRAGAAGLFALAPRALSLDVAAEWYALGRRLTGRARHIGFLYFERSASVLTAPDGLARLASWVEAGLPLLDGTRPHAGAVAEAYFEGAPAAVSMLPEPARWVRALLALGGAIEWQAFSAPSLGLRALAAAEQGTFLDAVAQLAPLDADGAARVYRELPRALALLSGGSRAAVLALLAQADGEAGRMLAELAAKLPATLMQVPERELVAALAQVLELAALQPSAAAAALAHLPELYQQAEATQVAAWFEAGRRLAAANPAAALAFFALESRTSISVLRAGSSAVALDDALGVWRKLIQMISGEGVMIERGPESSLRPPLEAAPEDGFVTLPERVEWLGSPAQNRAVYRFLALQLAGRREFGTYRDADLRMHLRRAGAATALEALFLLAEGVRVQAQVARAYPGSVAETRATAAALLESWREEQRPTLAQACDTLLAVALVASSSPAGRSSPPTAAGHSAPSAESSAGRHHASSPPTAAGHSALSGERDASVVADHGLPPPMAAGRRALSGERDASASGDHGSSPLTAAETGRDLGALLPCWLPLTAAEALLALLTPLWRPDASVDDSLALARRLLSWLAAGALGGEAAGLAADGGELEDAAGLSASDLRELEQEASAMALAAGSTPISGPLPPDAEPSDEPGEQVEGEDFGATEGLPAAQEAADEDALQGHVIASRRPARRGEQIAQSFLYDEWDHTISDYRSRYCRVHEIEQAGDSGAFFDRARTEYAHMLSEVRRQFERVRPERYRPLRGLEDGEDFDLNALTDARIEARAHRTPEARIYTARKRQQRDVATLFLLDMSASTEQPFVEPGQPPAHRIIDTLKEALVVMSCALDSLGDQYAIYGFSSRGRQQVEVYAIKAFAEPLSTAVKARIGGITPKSGTRMGAALRHVVEKLAHVHAQSKHLILLSDGFPQDQDYGSDRRTHTYGIEDTAVALREVSARGTTPFCITVDRAGNDYLRRMCEPSQYLVIDHVEELPRELPKIYRRVVRS